MKLIYSHMYVEGLVKMSDTKTNIRVNKSVLRELNLGRIIDMTSHQLRDLNERWWNSVYENQDLNRPIRMRKVNNSIDVEFADLQIRLEDTGELVWVFSNQVSSM